MQNFSTYGHYFRTVSSYQDKFKEVFSFSPHEYPIHLSIYYYNKSRAVSMSVLGVSDLALDNDMFGYSPYFYFDRPTLTTLFPIQFGFAKCSYIKFRFLLPVQFYKDYSEFIHEITRIRFRDIQHRSCNYSIFKFAFPRFVDNRYLIKDAYLHKRRVRKIAGQEVENDQFLGHRLIYIKDRESSDLEPLYHISRVFSNPMLSLPRKSRFKLPKPEFIFRQHGSAVLEPLQFSVKNYAFCISQIFIPFLQRFVKFMFKLERKLVFTEFFKFYTGPYKSTFAKFFYFTKEFVHKFFSKIKEFCEFTDASVSYPASFYFVFLYNQVARLSTFIISLVGSFIRGPYTITRISQLAYSNLSNFFIYRSLLWAKFSFVFNFLNLPKLKFTPKPYIHFKVPGNLKNNFFTQFLRFQNVWYNLVFFYFSAIGSIEGSFSSYVYSKIFARDYNFYLGEFFTRNSVFFFFV
jgi:hypothetical protein